MRKLVLLLTVLALSTVGFAACGGSDDDGAGNDNGAAATEEPAGTTGVTETGSAGGSEVAISADPSGALAYEQQAVVGQGNAVTIDLTNDAAVAHDVRIEDADGNDLGGTEIFANAAESVTLDLEPGEYTFFCSVPGHRQAGMEGTLTVK